MKNTLITIVLFFSFVNVSYTQTAAALELRDKLLQTKLDSLFAGEKENEPGGSFYIEKGGRMLYSKSFGLADLKTGEKFTSKTVSNTGSITKTFVAYGILILQKMGKLSIEDNLLKYFPDFKNKEIASKIKLRHMLTHSSGLPDLRNVRKDSVFYLTAKDEENFAPLKQADSLEFEPGTNCSYSNPCFNGLALIIEKVSGMKWQTFIDKYVFQPSGMKNSKITDGSFPDVGVAHSYVKKNEKYQELDYGEYPTMAAAGNGGVWSSVEELLKYVNALKNISFLDRQTIKFSQTIWIPPLWKGKQPPFMGFSWFIYTPQGNSRNYRIEHTGSQAGFRGIISIYPDADIVLVGLSNNDQWYPAKIVEQLVKLKYIN